MKRAKPFIFVLCLVPLAWLIWRWSQNQLGFNKIEAVARFTGDWTLRFLLLTLTITPLKRIRGWGQLQLYRRMLGLFAFFYGTLHFLHYIAVDKEWDLMGLVEDFTFRRFFIAGLVAWALMIPLAATSTNAAIRKLGAKRWQALHRLVYASAILGVIHYYWQAKAIVVEPVYYAVALSVLLLYRVTYSVLKSRSASRQNGRTNPQRNRED